MLAKMLDHHARDTENYQKERLQGSAAGLE